MHDPPAAKKIPKDVGVHGDRRIDDYFWMMDRKDPAVVEYLESENEYTAAVMKRTEHFQEKLYQELVGRIKETDQSVPEKIGDFHYYTRTEKDKQYEIFCRRRGDEGAEEVLLDENALAEGHNYFNVGILKVSPNHALMAFSIDTDGSESYTLYVKDLTSGELLEEKIPNTYYGVEWANDNKTLFYTCLDEAKRPFKLFRHTLGLPCTTDEEVYHEKDDSFFVGLKKTKSQKYLLLKMGSHTTTETHYLDADHPREDFRLIQPRRRDVEYYARHHGDYFYILTNDGAKNFKLMKTPVKNLAADNWVEVVPGRKDVKIDDVDVFADHVVIYEREGGLKKIRVMDLKTGENHHVDFWEAVYTFWPTENPVFESSVLRFNYSSLVTPRSVYDYDMNTRETILRKRYEVLDGYDSSDYRSERIFAAARDGARIPMSVVYKKGVVRKGGGPAVLYGYGAYGTTVEPLFASSRLSLLDRGFVYAIAHVRGGGEMGRRWYDEGKLLNKRNTFTDFIACADLLVEKGYSSAGEISIIGGSAGGMLVGAVMNMRPNLFRACVAHVPFVDVLTTMLDDSIPLTITEYEEWGNPNDKKYYEYIRSYSPYDNVGAQRYPDVLITAGFNDPRVQYWEPAKWAAKLRSLKTNEGLLLLKTKMGEGHGGASGRYDYLRDLAFEYAFVCNCYGITR